MGPHVLAQERRRHPPSSQVRLSGLLQLGWPHFWLLIAVLGGILGVVAIVLFWPNP